jgi:hypothetical protein
LGSQGYTSAANKQSDEQDHNHRELYGKALLPYVDRDHMATRYNEKNCNGQCVSCNRYGDGNKDGYEKGLVKKYGLGILQELTLAKHQTKKFSKSDLIELEKEYKQKIKELKKLKIAA